MSKSSRARREGQLAYCPSDDPEERCPYKDSHMRSCWLEGWYREERFIDSMQAEAGPLKLQAAYDEVFND